MADVELQKKEFVNSLCYVDQFPLIGAMASLFVEMWWGHTVSEYF